MKNKLVCLCCAQDLIKHEQSGASYCNNMNCERSFNLVVYGWVKPKNWKKPKWGNDIPVDKIG
jgi:hypothetical protein